MHFCILANMQFHLARQHMQDLEEFFPGTLGAKQHLVRTFQDATPTLQ